MGSYFRDYLTKRSSERPTVGDTKFSATSYDHMGWLKCDGRALSVADYNLLFQVIGYSFSAVKSGTTFNLPDAEGRVPAAIGQATNTGNTWTLGDISGQETHTLTINQMPAHKHGSVDVSGNTNGNGNTTTNGAHTHTGTTDAAGWAAASANPAVSATTMDVADNTGSHTHTFTTNSAGDHNHTMGSTGGGAAHNNIQPTIWMGSLYMFCGRFNVGSYAYTTGTNVL
jgi:microcystin-dependent protein